MWSGLCEDWLVTALKEFCGGEEGDGVTNHCGVADVYLDEICGGTKANEGGEGG